MDVEKEIEELKELVEQNIIATQEVNRTLRKMQRSAMWGWVLQIMWWLFIAGVTGAAYYYYVQPYVAQIQHLYGMSLEQSNNWNEQIMSFLKYFGQQGSSASSTPTQ